MDTMDLMDKEQIFNIQQEIFNVKVRNFMFTFLIAHFTVEY